MFRVGRKAGFGVAVHQVDSAEQNDAGRRRLRQGSDVPGGSGLLHSRQLEPVQDLPHSLAEALPEFAPLLLLRTLQHGGAQLQAPGNRALGKPARCRRRQQVDDEGHAGRNAYKQPGVKQGARCLLAKLRASKQVHGVGDDERKDRAERAQLAGGNQEQQDERNGGHAGDTPHGIVQDGSCHQEDQADQHGDDHGQRQVDDQAGGAVHPVEEEHDIDRQRRVRGLEDRGDQRGQGADDGQAQSVAQPPGKRFQQTKNSPVFLRRWISGRQRHA